MHLDVQLASIEGIPFPPPDHFSGAIVGISLVGQRTAVEGEYNWVTQDQVDSVDCTVVDHVAR